MSRALDELRNQLQEAKRRLPIPELWKRLGYPGEAKIGMVCCPFHREKSASFHIFDEGKMFKCFGCGVTGDAVIFLEKGSGLSRKDAIHKLIELAGCATATAARTAPAPLPVAKTQKARTRPELPEKTPGTPEQRAQLSKLRKLEIEAIDYAVELGFLSFCIYDGDESWLLSDATGVNAQVRKLDGRKFVTASGEVKAKTLSGSWAKWPIGVPPKTKRVILAEGGPDFLAACQLCAVDLTLSPTCLFGASLEIHDGAVPLFHGCDVFIVPHRDDPGAMANVRWTEQLKRVANSVRTVFLPELETVNDLNDLLALPPAERAGWTL